VIQIVQAALEGVSARRLVDRACADSHLRERLEATPIHVVAAGKAAAALSTALLAQPGLRVRSALAIGTHASPAMPPGLDWWSAAHPYPDTRSVTAGLAALARAGRVGRDESLLLLLSGGASSLMAVPADGLSLPDKAEATRALMLAGADIDQLNTLRKHLSAIKGGWLAAASRGRTITLAVSDVPGDDPSVIGSGPGVPDPTTWSDVDRAITACGVDADVPSSVRARIGDGLAGRIPETPKPGDPRLALATAHVIGRAADAVIAARAAAASLGYESLVLERRIAGEARSVAAGWLADALALAAGRTQPVCVVSSGETTVRVRGPGRGGRNLEFALALVEPMTAHPGAVAASVGTDGIDGTTDVAGARVDATTARRAASRGLAAPAAFLDRNDSYNFFAPLGDTIRTGRTDTNVGDLQVLIVGNE
jgi:glycerate-2-kinase